MSHKTGVWMSVFLGGTAGIAMAGINWLSDPSFEELSQWNDPNPTNTSGWISFERANTADWGWVSCELNIVKSGKQALRFTHWGGNVSAYQDPGLILDSDKTYEIRFSMRLDNPSVNPINTNETVIGIVLQSSPTQGGTDFTTIKTIDDIAPSATGVWENFEVVIDGSDPELVDHHGEYIRFMLKKFSAAKNSEYEFFIDDIAFGEFPVEDGLHTVSVDVKEAWNVLADPGFESLVEAEPESASAPWFSSGESDDWNVRVSTNLAYTGNRSVMFADYWEKGAVVQNVDVQVDPSKYYRLSVMMAVDEPASEITLTNTAALHATVYTSPEPQGSYTYRRGFFWSKSVPAGSGWEKLEGVISGSDLAAFSGEYLQVRIIKANEKTSHRIFIDNASLSVLDSPNTPGSIGRYLVGANVVYTKEKGSDWAGGYKTEVLKRAGMSNLRYPGGHVVSYWDWEWPYHNGYQDFWNPGYSLTAAESNALYEAHSHLLSLDDYLDICRETDAVPVIGINMLQGYKFNRDQDSIDKAVRLVNYVKDRINGPRYYYLDNEAGHQPESNNHVPADDYIALIDDYSIAIKAADPLGKIAVNTIQWNPVEEIIRDYGEYVDLIDHHWYYNNGDWGRFSLDEWRVDDTDMNGRVSRISQFNNWLETYEKPHIELGFQEWNLGPAEGEGGSTPGTVFYQGLVQADMMMILARGNVKMGTLWPLTWNDGSGGSFRDLADGDAQYVSPAVYIHRAFSKAAGGTILNMTEPVAAGVIRSLAVKSEDEGFIDLYFLNKSTETVSFDLNLSVPVVEAVVMTYTQGATDEEVEVSEYPVSVNSGILPLSLPDTAFIHVRCRLPGNPVSYEVYSENFENTEGVNHVVSSPYPIGVWHLQGTADWSREEEESSVDVSDFNGTDGREMQLGWGYDEVAILYAAPFPIYLGQTYTFRGKWEIGNVVDVPRGFIAGIAEFSADDGSLVQRLTSDALVFGNTNTPAIGETGMFEVVLSADDLAAAGTVPGNRIGLFLHCDDGGDLYDDTALLKNDVYYIDNLSLEVSGSITMEDRWMVSNRVCGALADSDGDGVNNRTEYWYGGDPALNDAEAIRPTFAVEENWINYVYRRRSDPVLGLTYAVESCTNLITGDWSRAGIMDAGSGSVNPEIDSVTNRLSIEGHPEQFIRLIVE